MTFLYLTDGRKADSLDLVHEVLNQPLSLLYLFFCNELEEVVDDEVVRLSIGKLLRLKKVDQFSCFHLSVSPSVSPKYDVTRCIHIP